MIEHSAHRADRSGHYWDTKMVLRSLYRGKRLHLNASRQHHRIYVRSLETPYIVQQQGWIPPANL
jgi:hypothetical protein